ncbi:MAG: pentapeptide repeat-containing protein [Thermodesulfovibrionales bacterium]
MNFLQTRNFANQGNGPQGSANNQGGGDWNRAFRCYSSPDLSNARLEGANLSGAILDNANMVGANLKDAILYKADLSNANLSELILSNAIWTDGRKCAIGSIGKCN